MVSMAQTAVEDEKEEAAENAPLYPYGLCISLCNDELEKLDIDSDDLKHGDILHLHCLATVTSTSVTDTQAGKNARVELQITNIAAESEDDENEEMSSKGSSKDRMSKLYL